MVSTGLLIAGRYRVVRTLAHTDVGVLLEARHLGLDDLVIMKILSERVHDRRVVARFVREARHGAKVKSDHVARFVDVGRLEDERPFIVMEHLEGEDLETASRSRQVPIEVAVDWIIEACDAVAAAHAVGILHRDLRTSSLFLTYLANGERRVKVMNFGTSRVYDSEGREEDPGLTVAGLGVGMPDYSAPELLLRGSSADVRVDVWSLGVILYELLTGRRPFSGTPEDAFKQILVDTPPDPCTLRADVPEELGKIVMSCLEKRREDRPGSARSLAGLLQPFASDAGQILAERISTGTTTGPLIALPRTDPPEDVGVDETEASIHVVRPGGKLEKGSYADLRSMPVSPGVAHARPRSRTRWPWVALVVLSGAIIMTIALRSAQTQPSTRAAPSPSSTTSPTTQPTSTDGSGTASSTPPETSATSSAGPDEPAPSSAPTVANAPPPLPVVPRRVGHARPLASPSETATTPHPPPVRSGGGADPWGWTR